MESDFLGKTFTYLDRVLQINIVIHFALISLLVVCFGVEFESYAAMQP